MVFDSPPWPSPLSLFLSLAQVFTPRLVDESTPRAPPKNNEDIHNAVASVETFQHELQV